MLISENSYYYTHKSPTLFRKGTSIIVHSQVQRVQRVRHTVFDLAIMPHLLPYVQHFSQFYTHDLVCAQSSRFHFADDRLLIPKFAHWIHPLLSPWQGIVLG